MNIKECPKCKKETVKHEKYGSVCVGCREVKECKKCGEKRDTSEYSTSNRNVCSYCIKARNAIVTPNLSILRKSNEQLNYIKEMRDINNMFLGIDNL